ncbi:MAG: M3 family oligoendopeptidase [Firmicutes bacterium]|nr:M3 family oligoendopeptidase [Bacillota bacterium]
MDNSAWKFSELKYERPNLNVYKAMFDDATERVAEAESAEEIVQVMLEIDEMTRKADDLVRVAYIRHTKNTKDSFYTEQQHWFDENMIYYDQSVLNFSEAVCNSPFRNEIEEIIGTAYFVDSDIQSKTFSDDCIELYQRESELCSEYQEIMESTEAEFMGEMRNIDKLRALFAHNDRSVRRAAFEAFSKIIKENEDKLEVIWNELIAIRNQVGRNLGYESFIPVGYLLNQHIYYTPEDVAVFREQVTKEIVPLCEKLYLAQKERLGVDELMVYDEKAVFADGNANSAGDAEYMLEKTRAMYHDISQEAGEFIDYMFDHELFDYEDRPEKAPGGYSLMLLAKKAPFVFTRFDGSISDFQVVTGDLGEAFARYVAARKQPLKDYFSASGDIMEIYALSMCQFAYKYAEDFFGEDADKYRFYNMQELITLIPAACAVDEFQHICYSNPDLTPKERTLEWRKLEKKYLPWRKYDQDECMESGGYWYSLSHVFYYPFYYINYALARVHAMEMKKKYALHPKVTWMTYMSLIEQGGRLGYDEVVEKAGLTPLFTEGAVAEAMSYAKEVMEDYLENKEL